MCLRLARCFSFGLVPLSLLGFKVLSLPCSLSLDREPPAVKSPVKEIERERDGERDIYIEREREVERERERES